VARRTAALCGLRRPDTRGHDDRRASLVRWDGQPQKSENNDHPGACRYLRLLRRPRGRPGSRVTLRRSRCPDV